MLTCHKIPGHYNFCSLRLERDGWARQRQQPPLMGRAASNNIYGFFIDLDHFPAACNDVLAALPI